MRHLLPVLVFAALILVPRPVHSGIPVPSPAHSTVPVCIRMEPGGSIGFDVVVRDMSGNPLSSSAVTLDFCACPDVSLCPGTGGNFPGIPACQVVGVTNALGMIHFALAGGGGCTAGGMSVYADGFLPATRAVASPDQDGNLHVDATDLALLGAKVGGSDPTGDLDCTGNVSNADLLVLEQYLGSACGFSTPARPRSWGTLKRIYR